MSQGARTARSSGGLRSLNRLHSVSSGWRADVEQADRAPAPTAPKPSRPALEDPAATTSGLHAAALRNVDPRARAAIAREADPARAAELVQRYSGPDGELEASVEWRRGGELGQ